MNPLTPFTLQNAEVVPPLGSRQPVPGTFASICPPGDFSWSEKQREWESSSHESRIKVLQFQGQSFLQQKPRLETLLIPQDLQIDRWERKERGHGPYEALELAFRKETPTLLSSLPDITCHRVLAFGDETFLILCTANYSASLSIQQEAEILASIQTIQYHTGGIFGHFPAHAKFDIDLAPHKLNWVPNQSVNPNGPFQFRSQPEAGQQPLQIVMEIHEGLPESPGSTLQALFRQNFFSSYQVLEVQPIRVDDIQGFEAFAIETNTQKENSRLEYVAILLLKDTHLSYHCMAPDDRITHLATFRQLLHSFQPHK